MGRYRELCFARQPFASDVSSYATEGCCAQLFDIALRDVEQNQYKIQMASLPAVVDVCRTGLPHGCSNNAAPRLSEAQRRRVLDLPLILRPRAGRTSARERHITTEFCKPSMQERICSSGVGRLTCGMLSPVSHTFSPWPRVGAQTVTSPHELPGVFFGEESWWNSPLRR